MYAMPRVGHGPAAVARLRGVLCQLDSELMARRLAGELSDTPVGRIGGQGCRPDVREDIVRRSAELIRNWLVSGQEPAVGALSELYEAARAAAGCGLTAEDVFRACCAVARSVRRILLESSPAEEWPLLVPQLDVPWAFLDVALTTVARAFADHEDLPSAGDNARATMLFARLCARSATTLEDLDRAARLGFVLEGPHCPFVVAIEGGSAAAHAGLAARLRAEGALACAQGYRVAGLTGPGFDWTVPLADNALILATAPTTEPAGIADAVGNLHDLVTLASRAGRRGRIRPDDFVTEIMLANSPQLAETITQRVLGRLNAEDPTGTLAQTLACLAAHGFDRAATAAALPVHRNTLLYRINRIEKLSGLDLDHHAHRELARLAVVWTETTEATGRSG
jgi:hypothetical protein